MHLRELSTDNVPALHRVRESSHFDHIARPGADDHICGTSAVSFQETSRTSVRSVGPFLVAVNLIFCDVAAETRMQGRAPMGRNTRSRAREGGIDGDPAREVRRSKLLNFVLDHTPHLPLMCTLLGVGAGSKETAVGSDSLFSGTCAYSEKSSA